MLDPDPDQMNADPQPCKKAGLAIKNPPQKTHPKKPTQKNSKKPTKNGFLGFF
jgi:hypothetical protein